MKFFCFDLMLLSCNTSSPGMIPHKLPRGKEALTRVKVFEGIPAPYDKQKRLVVPSALKLVRLKPRRKVHFGLIVDFLSSRLLYGRRWMEL